MAVQVLKSRGVPEDHILFLNLIASPEGIKNFATKFPKLRVVTSFIDQVCEALCRIQTIVADSGETGLGREKVWSAPIWPALADVSTAILFQASGILETGSIPSSEASGFRG